MFPVLNLGPLSVPAPAIILILGYLAGSYLLDKKSKAFGIEPELLDRAIWIGTISAIIGARLSFIGRSPEAFKGNLLSVFSLNSALLDPVGGLVIGIAAIYFVTSRNKLNNWKILDSFTPFLGALLPAYFLSRFASGNGYGLPTAAPWGVYLWGTIRHPVQLYLASLSIVPLIVVLVSAPFKKFPLGSTFLFFTGYTSLNILVLTGFQEPSSLIFGLRIGQIVSWGVLFASLLILNSRFHSISVEDHYETKE